MTITLKDGSTVRICNRCEGTIEIFGSTVVIVPDPDCQAEGPKLRNLPPHDLCAECAAEFWCWLQGDHIEITPTVPNPFSDN